MNQRGVFITFMVFLLVTSVIALHDTTKKNDYRQERKYIDDAVFNKVNNAFNNLYEEVVSLNKEGNARIIQERSLPFSYDFNKNSISLSQQVPVKLSVIDTYIDSLNIYSIFTNSEIISDLNITTKTIQNTKWNGSEEYPGLNYAILPQCLLYDINADSIMILRELETGQFGCLSDFNYLDLNIVDINISINSNPCIGGSYIGTLEKTEDPVQEETDPYYRISINEINSQCPGIGCKITESGKDELYGYFDPENYDPEDSKDWLTINCDTGGGTEPWLRIKLGKESENDPFPFVAQNFVDTQPVDIDLKVTFDSKVDLFYFTGFSISVNKVNFPIKRRT